MASLANLRDLFLGQLRDLYDAERQIARALDKLARAATDPRLKELMVNRATEAEGQVSRLEQAFARLACPPRTRSCHAMRCLVAEGLDVATTKAPPAVRDAALIAVIQRIKHYEIAAYGSAHAYAEALGADGIAQLLDETRHEESEADMALTALSRQVTRAAALNHEVLA